MPKGSFLSPNYNSKGFRNTGIVISNFHMIGEKI